MSTDIFPDPTERQAAAPLTEPVAGTITARREGHYRGIEYVVEARAVGQAHWQGQFQLQSLPISGTADALHPSLDPTWATENEALNFATEAACHAIEIREFGRPQGQGHDSPSSARRTDSLGQ